MNLIKKFELYVHVYTSDHFNGKRFYCGEPSQADGRKEASNTTTSQLERFEPTNLIATLQPLCNARL